MLAKYETTKVTGKITKVGRVHADIGDFCFIGCDLTLEDRVHIATGVRMVGNGTVYLSEGATIAPNTVFYTSMPDLKREHVNKYGSEHKSLSGDIYIGRNVFIGANSVIGCGVRIEDGVRLPPLSNVKPYKVIRI